MKQIIHTYSKEIEDFSSNSVYERTNVRVPSHDTVITPSQENEIFRIIHSTNRTFVSISPKYIQTIYEYLRVSDIAEKLSSPSFYREILVLLGYEPSEFLLEPSEEFLQNIHYNCTHTLDYACTKDTFIPQRTSKIETIRRGDERFILGDDFDSTMYCITENNRMIGCSYFKPNNGVFANTCSMQVYSRPEHRGKGYGQITASAATQAVVMDNKIALWVCQVENIPSRRIAESLGYVFLGGELRIFK